MHQVMLLALFLPLYMFSADSIQQEHAQSGNLPELETVCEVDALNDQTTENVNSDTTSEKKDLNKAWRKRVLMLLAAGGITLTLLSLGLFTHSYFKNKNRTPNQPIIPPPSKNMRPTYTDEEKKRLAFKRFLYKPDLLNLPHYYEPAQTDVIGKEFASTGHSDADKIADYLNVPGNLAKRDAQDRSILTALIMDAPYQLQRALSTNKITPQTRKELAELIKTPESPESGEHTPLDYALFQKYFNRTKISEPNIVALDALYQIDKKTVDKQLDETTIMTSLLKGFAPPQKRFQHMPDHVPENIINLSTLFIEEGSPKIYAKRIELIKAIKNKVDNKLREKEQETYGEPYRRLAPYRAPSQLLQTLLEKQEKHLQSYLKPATSAGNKSGQFSDVSILFQD